MKRELRVMYLCCLQKSRAERPEDGLPWKEDKEDDWGQGCGGRFLTIQVEMKVCVAALVRTGHLESLGGAGQRSKWRVVVQSLALGPGEAVCSGQ